MVVAASLGISLARFEGREYATTYEYDEQGRLVRSVTESEWDEDQQGWMLALAEYRASRCGGCGQDVRESTSHERDGIDYQTSKIRCRACDVLAVARNAYEGDRPEAIHWYVKRKR